MYKISKITSASPVDFAAEELRKYLRMMMPRCGAVPVSFDPNAKDGIRLGLMQDFGIDVSEAKDTNLDDIIHLEKDANGQIIAGSNPRSVLLAVYKFLKLNGCRWLFPGVDGEYIPMKEIEYVNYHKMADNRYRGQCNEGSTAQINYLDAIDFVPKIGMNIYMLEFDIPTFYYKSWYGHRANLTMTPELITDEQVLQWKRQCECEIQKRGLQYHDMGHGWTGSAFGADLSGTWEATSASSVKPEDLVYTAQINGERGLFKGVIMNTQFCMSNPEARRRVVKSIADYSEKQNYVDFLHVWLADARDNHCECDECKKMTPSDWYVMMLNELDAEMTKRKLDTHIVFIAYTDTLYPPIKESIKDFKRFSLLFAPISRRYDESYLEESDPSKFIAYNRNCNVVPKGIGAMMGYLDGWKEKYEGDVLCYEYHFWKPHIYEPSYQHIARNIYDDIHGLKKHGLNGIIEDQTPRNYMPSGLAQNVYGEALFDLGPTFEELEEDYMSHAFGENWKKVRDFLESICEPKVLAALMYPDNTKKDAQGKVDYTNPELAALMDEWKKNCEEFKAVVDENQNPPVRCQQVLWRNLYVFLEIVKIDADVFQGKFKGDHRQSYEAYYKCMREIGAKELSVQKYFDLGLWGQILRFITNPGKMFTDIPE